MKHHPEPAISSIRRQAIDALLQARQLPIGRDRNELRQLAIGLRGLAALQEMKDWQSQTALIGGFVSLQQPRSRHDTVVDHDAALPHGDKDSGQSVYRLVVSGLRDPVGHHGIDDLAGRHQVGSPPHHVHRTPKQRPALDGRSLVIQKLARQFGVKLRQHEDSLL
jgi:hypothetical protein